LTVNAWGRLSPPPLSVPSGSEDVLITIARGGKLEGRTLLPEGMDGNFLDYQFDYADRRDTPGYVAYADGSFSILASAPGMLHVDIRYYDTLLWRSESVEIRAGETTSLGEIDLRDKLFAIAVEFVDEALRPVTQGTVYLRGADGDSLDESEIPRSGRVRIFALQDNISFSVQSSGFLDAQFEGVRDGDRRVLREGIAVRVALPANLPAVVPPIALRIGWQSTDESIGALLPPDSDGRAEFRLPAAGEYDFGWVLVNELSGAQGFPDCASPIQVEVPESGLSQAVLLPLDPACLLSAIEKFRGG
jgi:hypothetical protein